MKKVVLASLILCVVCVGCRDKSTIINNYYYGDSNSLAIEKSTIEEDPNQWGIVTLNFDFGDANQSLRRGRTIEDTLSLISKIQEKKISYIRCSISSMSHYYDFYLNGDNRSNKIQVEVGKYNVSAVAYGDNDYFLFQGNKDIIIHKGNNEYSLTLSLNASQPIIIELPENTGANIGITGQRKNGENFTSYFHPLSLNSNQIIGAVPVDLTELKISCRNRVYTLSSKIVLNSLLFDEIIILDKYDFELATFINMNIGIEENKLIAGTQNVVAIFKVKFAEDTPVNSFQFELKGQDDSVDEIILIQEELEEDIELGRDAFKNNISTIQVPPIEFPAEEAKVFVLEAKISASATPESLVSFNLNSIGIAADIATNTVEIKQVNPEFVIALKGNLFVCGGYNLNTRIVLAGSTRNHAISIDFLANNEDIEVESLLVNIVDGGCCEEIEGSYMDVDAVLMYKKNIEIIEEKIFAETCAIDFPPGKIIFPKNTKTTFYVELNMAEISPNGSGTANADVKINISDIQARGLSSGRPVEVVEENLESNARVLRDSKLDINNSSGYWGPLGAATKLSNGDICIYVSRLQADIGGKNVLTYKSTYEVETNVKISKPRFEDQYGNIVSESEWTYSNGKYIASFYFDNPDFDSGLEKETIRIPSGENRSFYLFTIISEVASGSYLSIRQIGDDTCISMDIAEAVASESNLVWSDNHLELPISNGEAVNASQWYNGYLLFLPSSYTISY